MWTLWIVYFGIEKITEFNVYKSQESCEFVARKIVQPVIHEKIPEAVLICLPERKT